MQGKKRTHERNVRRARASVARDDDGDGDVLECCVVLVVVARVVGSSEIPTREDGCRRRAKRVVVENW